ncbi:putative reverse transcriptase domain-containing protein [Tanacetum coccineum]
MKKLLITTSHDSRLLAKLTAIEESKDLASLPLDVLVGNLKVYEMILENDGVVSKITTKDKVKYLALKANITRGQTSNNSTCQDEIDENEEINLMAKNFRKLSRKGVKVYDKFDICKVKTKGGESSRRERGCYNCGDKNHLVDNCPKPNNKAFVKVTWSDSEDGDEPRNDATCLMAIDSQEGLLAMVNLVKTLRLIETLLTLPINGNSFIVVSTLSNYSKWNQNVTLLNYLGTPASQPINKTIGNIQFKLVKLEAYLIQYPEYDLAHLKLIFEFCIYMVWKSVRYGISKELDTAYWGFLGVGTTFDIFQNIIFIPYLEYGVLSLSGYGVLSFILCGLW